MAYGKAHIGSVSVAANGESVVHITCHMCRELKEVPATQDQLTQWQGGGLIQNVMPHLSAAQRELLVSGTCGPCFDELFREE